MNGHTEFSFPPALHPHGWRINPPALVPLGTWANREKGDGEKSKISNFKSPILNFKVSRPGQDERTSAVALGSATVRSPPSSSRRLVPGQPTAHLTVRSSGVPWVARATSPSRAATCGAERKDGRTFSDVRSKFGVRPLPPGQWPGGPGRLPVPLRRRLGASR